MTNPSAKPLRLWPGVVIVVLQWVFRFGLPAVMPDASSIGILVGLGGGLAVVLWWLLLSRARWPDRLGAVLLMIVVLFAIPRVLDESIAKGAMGMLFPLLAVPAISLAFVVSTVATRHLSGGSRRAAMIAAILLASGVWALVRTGGVTGNFSSELHWRWAKTPEERLMSQSGSEPAIVLSRPVTSEAREKRAETQLMKQPGNALPAISSHLVDAEAAAEWPGFRGPNRDSVIPGVRIKTDWAVSPPVVLWRRPVGPGWSSLAVRSELLYTQEQRGPDEVVACYKLGTGQQVWAHRDAARFWESNGGAGPRATPTLSNDRIYTLGATGILNALKSDDGAVMWSRNAASDTGMQVPGWGFAGSPLVVGDLVVVAAAGRLVAYDCVTGRLRWLGLEGDMSYSSPQLMNLHSVEQIVLLNDAGAISVAPADGAVLWRHPWRGTSIIQPAMTAEGDVLVSTGSASGGIGISRLSVAQGPGGWTVEERWTSTGLKPYFNDFVVHKGHAFGFDGSILSCVDLKDGSRKWKGGRYGNGQLVLLRDQDLLLVLSEQGELALVGATPDQFIELARFPALEGKTWNHPVLVGECLLVRNGQEMAAFRLSRDGR